MSALMTLTELSVYRGPCPVVDRVSLSVFAGEVVGLIGPNGAGKTTLMRAALGLLPYRGSSSLGAMAPHLRAKSVAWMPQTREIAWDLSVEAVVMLGRLPHADGQAGSADRAAVAHALAVMGLEGFAQRKATALSGGEQARVLLARALAQDTPLLLADEPVAGLDPQHQITTMTALRRAARAGKGALVSLHDLGLAARHCDRLILMHRGHIHAQGRAEDVLTKSNLEAVFGISFFLETGPSGVIFQPLDVIEHD